jgi:hypothetical protein
MTVYRDHPFYFICIWFKYCTTNKIFFKVLLLNMQIIMGVTNVELGQDVAVEIRGETNGDIAVEYCDMTSLK